jgi:spore coat assembly protein
MGDFNVGDIVVRKSYGGDVYFKIVQINKKSDGQRVYVLKGTNLRLVADAPGSDLEEPSLDRISTNNEEYNRKVSRLMKKALLQRKGSQAGVKSVGPIKSTEAPASGRAGKVLHIDGDAEYLGICLRGYKQLGIEATGKIICELQQPQVVIDMLKEYRPDILVMTGHDGMIKGSKNYKSADSYRSSRYFIEAVRRAREYQPSYDELVIFAGACQSFYEGIMDAGANFASSPHRVLIHALDPVFICERIAYSNTSKVLTAQEVLENTITGLKGLGGLQTRGKYREGTPKSPYA